MSPWYEWIALQLTFELSEFMQEFATEVEGLTLRLVFKLHIIPPNEEMVQQDGGYLSKSKESTHHLVHAKSGYFADLQLQL
jgi:hypothetical protein